MGGVPSAVLVNPMGQTAAEDRGKGSLRMDGVARCRPEHHVKLLTHGPFVVVSFLLMTQSDRNFARTMSNVALADSGSMVCDAMRIQRTPRSLPAVFFCLCFQTLGLRLYEERMICSASGSEFASLSSASACACILTRTLREERVVPCKRNQICIPTRCQPSLPDTDAPFLQMRVLQYVRIRMSILKFHLRDVPMECGHPSTPVGVD